MRYDKATARRGEAYVEDKRYLRGKGQSQVKGKPASLLSLVGQRGNGTGVSSMTTTDVTKGVKAGGPKRKLRKKPAGRRQRHGPLGPGQDGRQDGPRP